MAIWLTMHRCRSNIHPCCSTLHQISDRHLRLIGPFALTTFEINSQLFQFLPSLLRLPFLPAAWWNFLTKHPDSRRAAFPRGTPPWQQFGFATSHGWSLNGDLNRQQLLAFSSQIHYDLFLHLALLVSVLLLFSQAGVGPGACEVWAG